VVVRRIQEERHVDSLREKGVGLSPLLTVRDLVVEFPAGPGKRVHAVSGVSFDVFRGETLGLVGESGSGKSTIGRAILRTVSPKSGEVLFDGTQVLTLGQSALRKFRPKVQAIFQDPIGSLNPHRQIADIIAEPLAIWDRKGSKSTHRDHVEKAMAAVGLDLSVHGSRKPHEFSGGQCQRVAIARALVLQPELLICDEAVSSLDVSVQAQILNLLEELKVKFDLTVIFISHDLSVVRHISDRIAVLYLGRLCEVGDSEALYEQPGHPYTAALLGAIPELGNTVPVSPLSGVPPSAVLPPSGCRFRTRCPRADMRCAEEQPHLEEVSGGRFLACHHAD